ncbi:uncharacterized protein [Typha latifolia]|uniref:uncharacterized protein n=1 Tax=Typha latifolia TaxID=4733 RepID=UPI003C305893
MSQNTIYPSPPSPLSESTAIVAASTSTTIPIPSQLPPNHALAMWRSRLGSALRTALACAVVGVVTIYGPAALRRQLTFPAFAYVTTILIVGEATLAESLHGAACALYGTVLGVLPAILTLFLVQHVGFSAATAATAVAVSAFVVALPDSTELIAKRIALGQIVIIYVATFDMEDRSHAKAIMHPVHVAASTCLGVVASLVALLLPYPRLAFYEVREKSKQYSEMAMERLRLLVGAFCADNTTCMLAFISQAKCFGVASNKLLQDVKLKQAKLQWERPPFKFLSPQIGMPSDRLQAIELPLKGMESALISTSSVPVECFDEQLKHNLLYVRDQISLRLLRLNYFTETKEKLTKTIHSSTAVPENYKDLASFFFLFCIQLLYNGNLSTPLAEAAQGKKVMMGTEQAANSYKGETRLGIEKIKSTCSFNLTNERILVAIKCSISLGLAVLFGILFSNDNGYWSGLTVAITVTPWRESTFKLANVRAQGTALGSVYGVLGSIISQRFMELRFLVLLPWIIFTSFLRRSKMYGQAGGIAAIISAAILLGRENYGPPTSFAIERLTETCMGLACSILVELLLQPTRASTLARRGLSQCLRTLHECTNLTSQTSNLVALKEKEKELRQQVDVLKKYIGEAESEPNFWFLPFPTACYHKLHGSLSKMVELLYFVPHSMELLMEVSHGSGMHWDEIQEGIAGDMEQFKKLVGSSVKCLEEVAQVKSIARLEKEQGKRTTSNDLEQGKEEVLDGALFADEEECEKLVDSFLQHAKEEIESIDGDVGGEMRSQVVLCLASFGFCIGSLMKETRVLEKGILDLVQWENPGRHINLHDIYCKIKNLSTI